MICGLCWAHVDASAARCWLQGQYFRTAIIVCNMCLETWDDVPRTHFLVIANDDPEWKYKLVQPVPFEQQF